MCLVSDLYIPRIGPHIFLLQKRQTHRGNILYKALTDTGMWKLGLGIHNWDLFSLRCMRQNWAFWKSFTCRSTWVLNGNGGNYMVGLGNPLVWEKSSKNSQMLRIPFGSFILNLLCYCTLFPPNPQLLLLSPFISTAITDKHPLHLRYHFRVSLSTHPLKILKVKQPF